MLNVLARGRYVTCVVFVLVVATVKCDVTLKDIYQASKNAIESGCVENNMAVVTKYYFTHEKENSAWYFAQETAKDMFNMPLSLDNLKFIEKLILSTANHYKQCIKMPHGSQRAQCFYHLATTVLDLETGSRWITLPELSVEHKAKFGTLYNSIALLISHLSLIAKENYKVFEDPSLTQFKLHGYRKALENIKRMIYDFDVDVINWRVDAISPPIVCEITERFWKEFVGMCETRWRRSVDTEDEPDAPPVTGTFVGASDELEVVTEGNQYRTREVDTILDNADRIGSSCLQYCIKFRVQVMDEVKNEVLYEEYKYGSPTSKSETMNSLALDAQVFRGKAVKNIKNKITELANNTFIPNYKIIGRTLAVLKE